MSKVYTTTTGKKIVIELQGWTEKFNYYFDNVKLYYNTRDYSDFGDLSEYEVEYLQGKCENDGKDEKLEKMKLDNIIIGFNIVDYGSNGCVIRRGDEIECDGFLIFEKTATGEYIDYVFKCLNNWWNGEIYCVGVYSPVYYKRMDKNIYGKYEYIKHWENIDYCDGFFDFDEAKNSYEKVIDASEMDKFYEYELIDEKQYKLETQPNQTSKE